MIDDHIKECIGYQHEILVLKDRVRKQEELVAKLLKENGELRDKLANGIAPNKQVEKIRVLQQEVSRAQAKLAKINGEKPTITPPQKVSGEMKMLRAWYPEAFSECARSPVS